MGELGKGVVDKALKRLKVVEIDENEKIENFENFKIFHRLKQANWIRKPKVSITNRLLTGSRLD
ncbi:hypothetical protein HanRHA438_Chr07g0316931 [Helianthus annuus]|nr:hypothetical protein HanIR_Chr07g0332391 [Helianthus annuus]KAJ0909018.1 hypothetical protein HanRHA438_Chr07g0316931 [Helianthus annuus]